MTKPLALIIEDDPQLSDIFTLSIHNEFEVVTITNGSDALARLAEESPRLIILDLNLPNVSGSEILSFVRKRTSLNSTKIVLCTADERQAEFLQQQADLVLLKPVSPIQLRDITSRFK
jgi:DNA-binding response OmpR family regulator